MNKQIQSPEKDTNIRSKEGEPNSEKLDVCSIYIPEWLTLKKTHRQQQQRSETFPLPPRALPKY